MTGELVNLRRVRKAKMRTDKASEAAANRALFGRTRAERTGQAMASARAEQNLDGHLLTPAIPVGNGQTGDGQA